MQRISLNINRKNASQISIREKKVRYLVCYLETFYYFCKQMIDKMSKALIYIVTITLLISIISCDQRPMKNRLAAIDSLIADELYDSAYKQTLEIEEHKIKFEEQLAHYCLLKFQTCYLTNNTLPADSILEKSTQYYQSCHNAEKLAECYYYKACQLLLGRDIEQCVLFLKKAEEQASDKGDARLEFKIAEALSYVNLLSANYSLSLDYARKALTNAKKHCRKDWMAYSYYRIGLAYFNLGKKDSALLYFDRTSPYIKDIKEDDRPYFLSNISLVYINHNPQKAKELLLESLSYVELVGALEQLASIYYDEGNFNEAYRLWIKAMTIDSSAPKDNIIHNLLEYDVEHGSTSKVCERVNEIINIKDSIIKNLKNDTIKDLQTRYDQEVAMNAASKRLIYWQQCVGGMVIILLIVLIIWIRKRNKDEKTIRQRELQIHHLIFQLEDMNCQVLKAENQIEHLEKQKELDNHKTADLFKKIEDLQSQKVKAQKESQNLSRKIEEWAGSEAWKVREGALLMEAVKNNQPIRHWSNEKLDAIVAYYCALHPDIAREIKHKSIPLTLKESLYLILTDMEKSKKEMSNILGIDVNTLRSYKYRINQKV